MIPRVNFVNKGNNEGKTPEKKRSLSSSHPQFHGYFPNLGKLNDIQFISVRNGNLETLNWHFHAN